MLGTYRKVLGVIGIVLCLFSRVYAYSGGSGTEADPYQIATVSDWNDLMNTSADWNKHFILIADVNLQGIALTPVGNFSYRFTGVFDGNDHIIRNVDINMPNSNDIGLFGWVSGGQIRNLGVVDVNIIGKRSVGGLAGGNRSGSTITACYATGAVTGEGSVGGLAGGNGSGSTVTACYATGAVTGGRSVGGLVGGNGSGSTITACYATGAVTGGDESSGLGGLVGGNTESIISNCYSIGAVTSGRSSWRLGGLVGENTESIISNCYSTGAVTGGRSSWYLGGLVGENTESSISNCYSTGTVTGGDDSRYLGGLVGDNFEGTVTASFWDKETSGRKISDGGTGLTTSQMKSVTTYQNAGWADNGWVISDGVDYPHLDWENTGGVPIPQPQPVPLLGSGTEQDPYQVWTAEDFALLSQYISVHDKHFALMADLDLSGITLYPIGNWEFSSKGFAGVFEGNGHIIRNAVMNMPSDSNIGLFASVDSNGQIRNLGIEDINIIGASYVGGLAGTNYGTFTACYITGSVKGNNYVGGLVGSNGGDITDCYATGMVTGSSHYVGGLTGVNHGPITACYTTGTVSGGGNCVGGLIGWNSGDIINCYSTDAANGVMQIGGLIGYNNNHIITDCYAAGVVTGGSYVGGLVGQNDGSGITACFWDIETSGQTTSGLGGRGLTTIQMKSVSTYQNAGWADKGWVISDGLDYPHLSWENTGGIPIPQPQPIPLSGSGTEQDPYQVQTADDFALLSWYVSVQDKHIALMADLDLSGITLYPIGDLGFSFTGVFEGNGHIIRNVNINMPRTNYIGLFASVNPGGQIRNLGVEDVNVIGASCVGGLVGSNSGDITACYATGTVTGYNSVGGLAGNNGGDITACYATSTVTGYSRYVGGLIGWNAGNITDCYATGAATGYSSVGGLAGINYGTIINCYATGAVSVSGNVGGLVGYGSGTSVTDCFWDIETSGLTTSVGGEGKTTAQMQDINTFLNAGWDFSYTDGDEADWFIQIDEYPILAWQISPADIYTDGRNNFRDFAVFAQYWMREDCAIYNYYCEWADMDFNGSVDIDDLIILMSYWLQSGIYN